MGRIMGRLYSVEFLYCVFLGKLQDASTIFQDFSTLKTQTNSLPSKF